MRNTPIVTTINVGKKTFYVKGDDVSDGYHTFQELYEHRCLLFINLVLLGVANNTTVFWKRDHFKGWDCIYWDSPCGQISYHVPVAMRPLYEGKIVECPDGAYDGHDSKDVIERLRAMARSL